MVRAFSYRVSVLLLFFSLCAKAQGPNPPNGLTGSFGADVTHPHTVGATGAMSNELSFQLPTARGDAQPALKLVYSSTTAVGEAGYGWALSLPAIERATLSGWPKYIDNGLAPDEDRFSYAGSPLTFICVVSPSCVSPAGGPFPAWAIGLRYYRLEIESTFVRAFLDRAADRWILQRRGGEILEFGSPKMRPDLSGPAVDLDKPSGKTFRWNLARQYDLHGSRNLAVYVWAQSPTRQYLRHVYYTPPALNWATATLDSFAYHVELSWENPTVIVQQYTYADRQRHHFRLRRVAAAAAPWSGTGDRQLVRTYHLDYYPDRSVPGAPGEAPVWGRSFLKQVQMEGTCATGTEVHGAIPDPANCPLFPPATFEYSSAKLVISPAVMSSYQGGPALLKYSAMSTAFLDVNRDGLPDIVQSWPQNQQLGNGTMTWDECPNSGPGSCPSGSSSKTMYWFTVRDNIAALSGPQLLCTNEGFEDPSDGPCETRLRSARENMAYVNQGVSAGGTIAMKHHCLDAGAGPGSLTWPLVNNPHHESKAFLFAPAWGSEHFGAWGDGLLLWSIAGYKPFQIDAAQADTAFCPDAASNANYPALAWRQSDDVSWSKLPHLTSDARADLAIDIDGDGYLDLLGSDASSFEQGFTRAAVQFTRKISAAETLDAVRGPALVPYVTSAVIPGAEPSMVGSYTAGATMYADINGDGVIDMITLPTDDNVCGTTKPGQLGLPIPQPACPAPVVRPGTGRGHFGCDSAPDVSCNRPGNGSWRGSAYGLYSPDAEVPWPLTRIPSGATSYTRVGYFHDVTGDGLADIVIFEPAGAAHSDGEIRLWVNVDGHQFRCANPSNHCTVAIIPGAASSVSITRNPVMFADLDGNGVDDFVFLGQSAMWHFSFTEVPVVLTSGPRAPRPGLLTRVRNGLGADTEIGYQTIQELDTKFHGPEDSFTAPWTSHVPEVIPVVTWMTTRDTSQVTGTGLGEPFRILRSSSFAYRDPAYDPWERSFKGFRRMRASSGSGEVVQSFYWFTDCNTGLVKDCRAGSDRDAKKVVNGALVRQDRFIPGVPNRTVDHWLSTVTYQYGSGELLAPPGTDADRSVLFGPIAAIREYLYDVNDKVVPYDRPSNPPWLIQPAPVAVPPPPGPLPRPQPVVLLTRLLHDQQGNLWRTEKWGRVDGNDKPQDDNTIISLSANDGLGFCAQDWACLPPVSQVLELKPGAPELSADLLRDYRFTYNAAADLVRIDGNLQYPRVGTPPKLNRNLSMGTGEPPTASTARGIRTLASMSVDIFGNIIQNRQGPASNGPIPHLSPACSDTAFDGPYAQFPATVTRHTAPGCAGLALRSEYAYDRGTARVTEVLSPRKTAYRYQYDEFKRLRQVLSPAPDGAPGATELAVDIQHFTQAPASWVQVRRRVATDAFLTTIDVFNGIGEHVLGFDQADPVADGAPWILRQRTLRDDYGRVVSIARPWLFSGNPLTLANTAPPVPVSSTEQRIDFDEFGRPTATHDDTLVTGGFNYSPLRTEYKDAEQMKATGPFNTLSSVVLYDGHGRIARSVVRDLSGFTSIDYDYLGTGEPLQVRQTSGASAVSRRLRWDSFGRLVENTEPNVTRATPSGGAVGWTYVYDDLNRLVGTSDARGCGKNVYYDALSRPVAEDFSPCAAGQPAYTPPNLATGDGTEVFYAYDTYEPRQVSATPDFRDRAELALGLLVAVQDRAAHTRFSYDARGRIRRHQRQLAAPGAPAATLASRYGAHWFEQRMGYDLGDRLSMRGTGLEAPELLVAGASAETYTYSARGMMAGLGSSYGPLMSSLRYWPGGQLRHMEYGDAAKTLADLTYNPRDLLQDYHLFRGGAAVWTLPTPSYSAPGPGTTQTDLARYQLQYDDVGNTRQIADVSTSTWPAGARQFTQRFTYDGQYRAVRVDYQHPAERDVPPFTPEATGGDRRPVTEVAGANRILTQSYDYDFLGNMILSKDNEGLVFDRSLGTIVNGGGANGPNQLTSTDTGITASYDAAGNLQELVLPRTTCWAPMPNCSHRFLYDWDEVGQLARARRWDYAAGPVPAASPSAVPAWDLSYAYSDNHRVRVSYRDSAGDEKHSLDVFSTFRISKTRYLAAASGYELRPENQNGFLGGMARVFFDRAAVLPRASATPRHVFLHLGNHLGSTAFVLDKDSGEVVERTLYQGYGALESDYRPDRWHADREEFKFTSKEEDIETGLTYFGARYYSAHLGRWISPDPLTIHTLGSDINPYAYVGGHVASATDPIGLEPRPPVDCPAGAVCFPDDEIKGHPPTPDRGPTREQQLWSGPMKYAVQVSPVGLVAGLIADPEKTVKTVLIGRLEMVENLLGAPNTTSDTSYTPDRARGSQGQPAMSDTDQLTSIAEQEIKGAVLGAGAGALLRRTASLETRGVAASAAEQCPFGLCAGQGRCFAAGTPVATPAGDRPIESIRPGDLVISRDEATGTSCKRRVARVFVTPDQETLEVALSAGGAEDRLIATPAHPFYVEGAGWLRADQLQPDMHVVTLSGRAVVVLIKPVMGRQTVYNFEVEDTHTYFVGKGRHWVHNQCSVVGGSSNYRGIVGEERELVRIEAENGTVIGEHVSFVGPTGQRCTVDCVWVDNLGVLRGTEVKFGEFARLTGPQRTVLGPGGHLTLTPVGGRAAEAGLTPGVPVGIWIDISRWHF